MDGLDGLVGFFFVSRFPFPVSRSSLSTPLVSPPQRCSAGPQSLPRVRRGADRGGGLWPNVTYFAEKVGASAKRNAHAGRIVHPRTLGYAQMAAADRAEMHRFFAPRLGKMAIAHAVSGAGLRMTGVRVRRVVNYPGYGAGLFLLPTHDSGSRQAKLARRPPPSRG